MNTPRAVAFHPVTPVTPVAEACLPLQLCPATDPWHAVFWDSETRNTRFEPVAVWALCKVTLAEGESTKVYGLVQGECELEPPEMVDMPPGSLFLGYCPSGRSLASFMSVVDPRGQFR